MAAGSSIAAQASIAGLQAFLSGLTAIDKAFGGVAGGVASANAALDGATGGFQAFNVAVAAVQNTAQGVGQAVNTITAPLQAVGTALGVVVEEAEVFASRVSRAIVDVATAAAGIGTIGIVGLGTALASAVGASVAAAAQFQQGLTQIKAIAQATPPEIARLGRASLDTARQFGVLTGETNDAALALQKAGVPVDDITGGILRLTVAVQQLSKGEVTVERAGEAIGSLLKLFEESFKGTADSVQRQAQRIANAVVATANATRASIGEVVSGLVRAGPAFVQTGHSIEQTASALQLLLRAGIRGEEAGTALRNLFLRLSGPSREAVKVLQNQVSISLFEEGTGAVRSFQDVLEGLVGTYGKAARAASGMTDAQAAQELATLFQTRVANAASLAILQGVDALENFNKELANTDVIRQAAILQEALIKQLQVLRTNVEIAGIAFGTEFLDGLGAALVGINRFLAEGNKVEEAARKIGKAVSSIFTGQDRKGAGAGLASLFPQPAATGGGAQSIRIDTGETLEKFSEMETVAERTFGAIAGQADRLGFFLGRLGESVLGLGRTILQIVFPEGPERAVNAIGGALTGAVTAVDAFVRILTNIAPTVIRVFGEGVRGAERLAQGIGRVLTEGQGLTRIMQFFDGLVRLAGLAAEEFVKVALAAAGFVRILIDNQDKVIGFMEIVIRGLSAAAQLAIFFAGSIAKTISSLADLGNDPTFRFLAGSAAGGLGTGIIASQLPKIGVGAQGGARDAEERIRGMREEFEKLDFLQRQPPSAFRRTAIDQIDQEEGALHRVGEAAEGAADSNETLFDSLKKMVGGFFDFDKAARDAEAAQKALEAGSRRLAEAQEDTEKQLAQIARGLQNTITSIQQRFRDGLESIEEQFEDSFNNITQNAERQRRKLQESFDISQANQAATRALTIRLEDERLIFERALEDRRRLRSQQAEDEERAIVRATEGIERELRRGVDRQTLIRQRGIDDQNRAFQQGQDEALRIFQHGQDDQLRALTRSFDVADTARSRGRDDARRQRDLARDLARATTETEREQIRGRFADETVQLRERRADEDQDAQIRRQREDSLLSFRRNQESALIKFRQAQEESAITRRRAQEGQDILFRIGLEDFFIQARQRLEDIATGRRRRTEEREIGRRREEQTGEEIPFAREQQVQQQALQLQQAFEALQRQLGEITEQEATDLAKLGETTLRNIFRLIRTTSRESEQALVSADEQVQRLRERFKDLETDILRNPAFEGQPAAAAEAAAAIERARGVVGAQTLIQQAQNAALIADLITRIGATAVTSQTSLSGFLGNLQTLREVSDAGGLVITPILQAPQFDRLTAALDRLAARIEQIRPGVNIEELNVQTTGTGAAVGADIRRSLQTVGGE